MSYLRIPGGIPLQESPRILTDMHLHASNLDTLITEQSPKLETTAQNTMRDLLPRRARSHSDATRELMADVALLRHSMKALSAEIIIANQKIDSLQRSNRQLQRETSSLRCDLYLTRTRRAEEGIQFMKFPLEIRIMIWHLAARSDLRSTFEIIQSRDKDWKQFAPAPVDFLFLVRCYSPKRIVAQACREARDLLQSSQQCKFPTPMWMCMNGQRDNLVLPHTFTLPLGMGYPNFLGPAKHIIVVPKPRWPHYTFSESSVVEGLLGKVITDEVKIQSMSFVMSQVRVSTSVQARLEFEFKSQFPLAIDLDDEDGIKCVNGIFIEFPKKTLILGDIADFSSVCLGARCRNSPSDSEKQWCDFKEGLLRSVLRASKWDKNIIEYFLARGRTSTEVPPPSYLEAYNWLPELKRVIMVCNRYEGPSFAKLIGPDPLESPTKKKNTVVDPETVVRPSFFEVSM